MSPEAAYVIEQPHLVPLPDALPPVYELLERVVDLHGYVSVDTNRYSVPERYVGKSVAVYKTPAEIDVCHKDTTIAIHRRLIGQRDTRKVCPVIIPSRCGKAAARRPRRRCWPAITPASTVTPPHSGGTAMRATGGPCGG